MTIHEKKPFQALYFASASTQLPLYGRIRNSLHAARVYNDIGCLVASSFHIALNSFYVAGSGRFDLPHDTLHEDIGRLLAVSNSLDQEFDITTAPR